MQKTYFMLGYWPLFPNGNLPAQALAKLFNVCQMPHVCIGNFPPSPLSTGARKILPFLNGFLATSNIAPKNDVCQLPTGNLVWILLVLEH